ncbi:hypothetical protein PHMEG_00012949 [Phytophthora megakarya]|uniref:Transposase n=1 Tax=Phytophthora megakarya TaxID=4795 RepID=A0A225W953_9STRA|nr:hypothetical protein PHMEG_00012949 [Phytophthora megakarya]
MTFLVRTASFIFIVLTKTNCDDAVTPAQIAGFYFHPCRDDHDEVILEYCRSRCGMVRKQTRRNGYSNMMQHIRREHTDYEAVMLAVSTAETGSMLNYVRQSALNVYGWMDCILKNNPPLSSCENRAARRLPATLMGVLLVGYASHRLHLAVQAYMDGFKSDLDSHLDMKDDALVEYLPPPAANRCLRALLKELKKIESVAKALQDEDVTLLDVRVGFDGLLTSKSPYERFIGADSPQTGLRGYCVRILSGDSSRLKRGERVALELSRRLEADSVASGAADYDARKEIKYDLLSSIHPTSIIAEHFFSVAHTTFGQERHSIQPKTLEMIMFLRQNSRCRNAQDVDDATH